MNFGETCRFRLPLARGPVRSLCWEGDELVDYAGDGARFRLDGSVANATINWAYRFDSAVRSRDGSYRVIYEKLGTKGLVLRGNRCIREINRSFYHAHVYEYPVAIVDLPDGVVGLIHCPDEYNRLEIEEIESGVRLTSRPGKSPDFFHSRLQVSPSGKFLLSAGWVWHPLDFVQLFSLAEAVKCAEHLDKAMPMRLPEELFEIQSTAFQADNSLLLVGTNESDDAKSSLLAQYSVSEDRVSYQCALTTVPGTIMPAGDHYFVGFFEHPKLFEICSGRVVLTWPDIVSGKQDSSIIWHREPPPPMAFDPARLRFAVADATGITVIQLGLT
jgi:hypothetical protein